MGLEQFKQWAIGQGQVANPNGTFAGECVSLVQNLLYKVHGIPYQARGNAKDWATNANVLSYFDKVSSPQAGDIGVSGATKTNPYGHIWIYLSPTQALEQNGRVALRVTVNPPLFAPIAILRRKGTGNMPTKVDTALNRIIHTELEGWNLDATHAGKSDNLIVPAWNGRNVEDMIWEKWNKNGAFRARREAGLKLLTQYEKGEIKTKKQLDEAVANANAQAQKEVDAINKEVERLQNERTADTELLDNAGNWLSKLWNRLFKK